MRAIAGVGPWGQNFPEPVFDGEFYLVQQRIVGAKHLKLTLSPERYSSAVIDAIAFNVDLSVWPNDSIQKVKVAYRLDENIFRERSNLQLMIEYIEPVESD